MPVVAHQSQGPGAIRTDLGAIFVSVASYNATGIRIRRSRSTSRLVNFPRSAVRSSRRTTACRAVTIERLPRHLGLAPAPLSCPAADVSVHRTWASSPEVRDGGRALVWKRPSWAEE